MDGRFVGRGAELAELTARLEDVLAGRTCVALVAGEPGIGKTRLVAELARLAGTRAVPVLWGGCTDEAGAPAYWPWRRILRAWLAATGPDEAAARLGDAAADLALIAPELAALGGRPAPAPVASGPEQRFALFDVATRFLTGLAAPAGLVLVLDDVQWADPASLALLGHLAREAPAARLLVALTCRSAEVATARACAAVLAELVRLPCTVRIELTGLTAADVAAALADRLGAPAGPAVVADVTRRTGGNPFFVGEVGRALAAEAGPDPPVPAAVRDVVGRRLDRLPEGCRALLESAAVIGTDVDVVLVAAVEGVPADEVLDDLRPALDDGVLGRPAGVVGLRFAHDLVREALLDALPPSRRARLHRRVADALEPAADGDPDVLPELARHALAALPLGDAAAAVGWARRAADLATAQLAYDGAARLLERAGSVAGARLPPRDRLELLLDTARAQVAGHEVAAAIRSCTSAADLARRLGDTPALGRAALVVQGVSEFAWMPTVRGWCEEALRGLPDVDSSLRAQLLAQLTHAIVVTRAGPAETTSAQALAMAERLGDRPALVSALRARQLARSGPEGTAERLALGDRMLGAAADGSAPDTALWGHLWRFDALLELGRVADAEAELDRLDPVVTRLRRPLARLHLVRGRAALAFGRGRFEEARLLNDEVTATADRGGHGGARLIALAFATLIAIQTGGEGPDPVAMADAPTLNLPGGDLMRAHIAWWHLVQGRRAAAARWYALLPPPGDPRIPRFLALPVEAMRAQLATDLGDAAAAADVHRILLPHADRHVCGGAGAVATYGSTQLFLGIAATGCGRLDTAVRHLRAAVADDDAAGLAPHAATARFRLAAALRARGRAADDAEAVAAAVEADAIAARLGMAPLRARVAELTARGRDGGVLSRRETEIAGLVARGLTNRQIAATAHISERTVEAHVQHILAKLGFSGRAQVAAWVAGRAAGTGS